MTQNEFDTLMLSVFPTVIKSDVTERVDHEITEYFRVYSGDSYMDVNPIYNFNPVRDDPDFGVGALLGINIVIWIFDSEGAKYQCTIGLGDNDSELVEDCITNKLTSIFSTLLG